MVRYTFAAGAALIALAIAGPAAARGKHDAAAPSATALSARVDAACAVPASASDPVMPPSPDSALEDKIDQLTSVINDLSDRLATLEDQLGDSDDSDADGDDGGDGDGLNLAKAPGARPHHALHRAVGTVHARPAAPLPRPGLAALVTPG